jgi:hypothetical protein
MKKKNQTQNARCAIWRAACLPLLLAALLCAATGYAQSAPVAGNPPVKGKVIDGSGQPLAGVTVSVQGTNTVAATDADGYYVIDAKEGQWLVFKYIGFKDETAAVPKRLTLDMVMKEDTKELDEVVVVGMGTQRKASVIGAISAINVAELKTPARSLTNTLAGRMAGVIAVQRSGEPGYDNSDFWIRGISTFGNNKTPLILIDGVEREGAMANLDPEEIESVSILIRRFRNGGVWRTRSQWGGTNHYPQGDSPNDPIHRA